MLAIDANNHQPLDVAGQGLRDHIQRAMPIFVTLRDGEGAGLATGGGVPAHLDRGWYVEPTVLFDVEAGATIAQEEVFGPVLAVIPYDSEEEAVRIANDSRYGLHGAVFSADDDHALAVARRIETGTCAINSFDVPLSAPFGGVKESGVGRENGVEGYDSYLEYKTYKLTPDLAARLTSG